MAIAKHYTACLPESVVQSTTLRDFLRKDNIAAAAKDFAKRSLVEKEMLCLTHHIIGRTEFDKACTRQVNHTAKYHHCNESLRTSFYENAWQLDACEKHSIFISQATSPIKGLHFMLEAMPEILKTFPDARLYVAGADITKSGGSFTERLKISSYGHCIRQLINVSGLDGKITFTGPLDEESMCRRYLKSHVFVSASSIENSSNSLGEAMLLGIPTVASNVGGTI